MFNDGIDPKPRRASRDALTPFPLRQRARIDAQLGRERSLGQTLPLPMPDEGLPDGCGLGARIVSQEVDNHRQPAELRSSVVKFPIRHRGRVHAELFGNVPLKQPQIKSAPPQVTAQRVEHEGITDWLPLLAQNGMAKRQRGDDGRPCQEVCSPPGFRPFCRRPPDRDDLAFLANAQLAVAPAQSRWIATSPLMTASSSARAGYTARSARQAVCAPQWWIRALRQTTQVRHGFWSRVAPRQSVR